MTLLLVLIILLVILILWYKYSISENASFADTSKLTVKYQPNQLAFPSFEKAHKHRLRTTVKDDRGMALSDYALEDKLLNQNRA